MDAGAEAHVVVWLPVESQLVWVDEGVGVAVSSTDEDHDEVSCGDLSAADLEGFGGAARGGLHGAVVAEELVNGGGR